MLFADTESVLLDLVDNLLNPEDANNDKLGRCLTMEQLQQLSEVVSTLRAQKRLHEVSIDRLLKLVNLLDRHVRLGCISISSDENVRSRPTSSYLGFLYASPLATGCVRLSMALLVRFMGCTQTMSAFSGPGSFGLFASLIRYTLCFPL